LDSGDTARSYRCIELKGHRFGGVNAAAQELAVSSGIKVLFQQEYDVTLDARPAEPTAGNSGCAEPAHFAPCDDTMLIHGDDCMHLAHQTYCLEMNLNLGFSNVNQDPSHRTTLEGTGLKGELQA
jgi:hypothetical protein